MRAVKRLAFVAVLVAAAALVPFAAADGETLDDFQCSLCFEMLDEIKTQRNAAASAPLTTWDSLRAYLATSRYCRTAMFGNFNPCDAVRPALATTQPRGRLPEVSRDACVVLDLCPTEQILGMQDLLARRHIKHATAHVEHDDHDEAEKDDKKKKHHKKEEPHHKKKDHPRKKKTHSETASEVHDLRVALSHGARGYDNIRVSYIDNEPRDHPHTPEFLNFFSYNDRFHYVWPNKTLHSAIKPITNGTNVFTIGNDFNISVRMPAQGKGVRGLLIADPCFSGDYVGCRHGKELKIFERLTSLLNTALVRDVDTWAIIGDNFYDPHGILVPQFMAALTLEAKSQPVISVPGNHDFWQHGSPTAKSGYDTYGNGYMQYWVTDTSAAVDNDRKNISAPLDFAVDPSTKKISDVRNFFTYNMIGNVATITFSGAHDKAVSDPLFAEACEWVDEVKPAFVFVIGHWSSEHLGCAKDMRTADVHARIITMKGCKEIKDRVKWFEGHMHCNWVVKKDTGFRVAGFGMGGCSGKIPNFGIPFFETTDDGELHVGYFPIVGGNGTVPLKEEIHGNSQDIAWDTFFNCVTANGIGGCKHLAVEWLHQKA
jgi:hypothetical protein